MTTRAPVVVLVEAVSSVILTGLLNVALSLAKIWLLNVTGPSNWERSCFESPPSTVRRSLIMTSSNTTLNLAGSSPVTVGIGVSKVVSSPVRADFFWLPI